LQKMVPRSMASAASSSKGDEPNIIDSPFVKIRKTEN
jgi:hypothetical protein